MKLNWNKKYTTIAVYVFLTSFAIILLLAAILNWSSVTGAVSRINSILMPVYVGIAMAYLFNPILKMCEKRIFSFDTSIPKKKTLQRALSLVLTYLIVAAILTVLILLIIPEIVVSFNDLIPKLGDYTTKTISAMEKFVAECRNAGNEGTFFQKMIASIDVNSIIKKAETFMTNAVTAIGSYVPTVIGFFTGFAGGLFDFLLGIFFSIYFLASKETLIAQLKKLLRAFTGENSYNNILDLCAFTDKTFGGYIVGKIVDSVFVGVLCFVAFEIFGIPYAILLSVLIAVTNFIPVIGPFIGAIPGIFLIFVAESDFQKVLWFVIINVVLQQLDGNIIVPKLLGEATGLSAVWVLFSITVMGGFFGFVGMLISVPIFAIIYTMFKIIIEKRLARHQLPIETEAYLTVNAPRKNAADTENKSEHSFAVKLSKITSGVTKNPIADKFRKKDKKDGKDNEENKK